MNIIMHYPESPDDIRELEKRVAEAHAQAVIQKIKSMPCPKSQKERLLDAVLKVGAR